MSAFTRRRLRPRYRRLFWRIFAANAVVLAAASATAVLILSPGSLTEPVALRELGIFAAALAVMVLANLVVTQRLVAPLEELVRVMRQVDLMQPGVARLRRGRPVRGDGARRDVQCDARPPGGRAGGEHAAA